MSKCKVNNIHIKSSPRVISSINSFVIGIFILFFIDIIKLWNIIILTIYFSKGASYDRQKKS